MSKDLSEADTRIMKKRIEFKGNSSVAGLMVFFQSTINIQLYPKTARLLNNLGVMTKFSTEQFRVTIDPIKET